jgi:adenylylsulfate kinase
MIILFYGQPASGKTTLADQFYENALLEKPVFFIKIDGDKWREITKNKDYSKEGRINNLKGAFNMALYLEDLGFTPVLSFVTPYRELRRYLRENAKGLVEIYLKYSGDRGRNMNFATDFEVPVDDEYSLCFDTSVKSINECTNEIIEFVKKIL